MNRRPVVWVIDDSFIIRTAVAMLLEQEGCDVVSYADPLQMLRTLRALKETAYPLPDVIFVDLVLPRMSGYSLIRFLRGYPTLDRVAIVVISRLDGVFPRLLAQLSGANAYLPKPFRREQLIETVLMQTSLERGNASQD